MASLRLHLARFPLPLISSVPHRLVPTLLLASPPPFLSRPRRFLCSSSLTPTPTPAPPVPRPLFDLQDQQQLDYSDSDSETEEVVEFEDDDVDGNEDVESGAVVAAAQPLPSFPSPQLSVKEKKELASYAHSLGKKLKSQQVGKSGVTPAVAAAFLETLESKELLKLKIHGNCPSELADAIKQLEQSTGSVAVDQIGRTVILYRPSLSKMKKKEAQSTRKVWRSKPAESSPPFRGVNKWITKSSESSPTFGAEKKWKGRSSGSASTYGVEKKWKGRSSGSASTYGVEKKWKGRLSESPPTFGRRRSGRYSVGATSDA